MKKFEGNDETGVVALLCIHGIVQTMVNMYLGER